MKKKLTFSLITLLFFAQNLLAQSLPDSCKLRIGINLGGLADWTTEMPFVDVMHQCRWWGTQNSVWVSGGNNPWDSQVISHVPRDAEGYPLQVPFYAPGLGLDTIQDVYTVWASTIAWPAGTYTLLYDGEGQITFWGDAQVQSEQPGMIKVLVTPGHDNIIQLKIRYTNPQNHLRNFRFLMPGTENTYQANPFYQPWLEKLAPFAAIRFMDWGATNNWSYPDGLAVFDEDSDSLRVPWSTRAQMTDFSWTLGKGIPYERMIQLCNLTHKDMWICVPHNADDDFIRQLAIMVRDQLEPGLKVYVEYSNEVWNWGFGQTQWLNKFGCVYKNVSWPEGIVPYIQNVMNIWTDVFQGHMNRLVRYVGVQGAWQDVSNRIVFNMNPATVDAFGPAAYFGLSPNADAVLDQMGPDATVTDVAALARITRDYNEIPWLRSQQASIADSLHIPMLYYEGGQHLTPHPFGQEPTYAQALLDIQRDTAMYNLYTSWFDTLRVIHQSPEPGLFMNFSFIGGRSARYGSWGILESVTQDTAAIPAPKYRAVLENLHPGCDALTRATEAIAAPETLGLYPNPATDRVWLALPENASGRVEIYDLFGRLVRTVPTAEAPLGLLVQDLAPGVYTVVLVGTTRQVGKLVKGE